MSKKITRTIKSMEVKFGVVEVRDNEPYLVVQEPIYTHLTGETEIYEMLSKKLDKPFAITSMTLGTAVYSLDIDDFINAAMKNGEVVTDKIYALGE